MPFAMLKKIPNDLSPRCKKVIDGVDAWRARYKIAWESRRFWEQDYNIYGGLSFLAQGPSPVWYPSCAADAADMGSSLADTRMRSQVPGFADMTHGAEVCSVAGAIEKLHPGHGKELTKPVFCGWRHVKWNEGSWIRAYGGGPAGYDVVIERGRADLFRRATRRAISSAGRRARR